MQSPLPCLFGCEAVALSPSFSPILDLHSTRSSRTWPCPCPPLITDRAALTFPLHSCWLLDVNSHRSRALFSSLPVLAACACAACFSSVIRLDVSLLIQSTACFSPSFRWTFTTTSCLPSLHPSPPATFPTLPFDIHSFHLFSSFTSLSFTFLSHSTRPLALLGLLSLQHKHCPSTPSTISSRSLAFHSCRLWQTIRRSATTVTRF